MDAAVFLIIWAFLIFIIYLLLNKPRPSEPSIRKPGRIYETTIRFLNKEGFPLVNQKAHLVLKEFDSQGYSIARQESLTGYTDAKGIVTFKHEIIGVGALHLNFPHNPVSFPVPNSLNFRVGANIIADRGRIA